MEIFEQFGLIISDKKCKLEPKREILLLSWNQSSATKELYMPNDRQSTILDLFKLLNTVQRGFLLSNDAICSTNTSLQRSWFVLNDEIPDASTARDVLVDQQDPEKQETPIDLEYSSRDSSYGRCLSGLGSNPRTVNGRISTSLGSLERARSQLNEQSRGDVGRFLRSPAAPQLASELRNLYRKIQHLGLQIQTVGQLGRLPIRPIISLNPLPVVGPRSNSGLVRKRIQQDTTSLRINKPERSKGVMDGGIQSYMGERNLMDPSTNPNDILDIN
ncbi:MAG: hypothetical protein EZS28_048889, partial [Streblomastix strix]